MELIVKCQCSDPGCPAHNGSSKCPAFANTFVTRIDMDNGDTEFDMCPACASDALDSGVFALTEVSLNTDPRS